MYFRQGVFEAAKLGERFGRFYLGPQFEESQKIADSSVFANLAL